MALLPPSHYLPRTSCDSASLGPPVECIWLFLVKQIARKCKIRIHSRSRGTQQVQILFCYLTRQVHTGGPFSNLIRPSWFLPLIIRDGPIPHFCRYADMPISTSADTPILPIPILLERAASQLSIESWIVKIGPVEAEILLKTCIHV